MYDPPKNYEYWERRCGNENQKIVIRAIVDIDKKNGGQSITVQELHGLGLNMDDLADVLRELERRKMIRDCVTFSKRPCIFTLNR